MMAHLGGMGAFVKQGQRILIKPNLLSDHPPEDAVTTHPEVVRAVIRSVKAVGGIPVVGDSAASAIELKRVWTKTGMEAVCREEGVELVVFEGEGGRTVTRDGFTFTLSHILNNVDGVINVCKVKGHVLMTLTAGVKNLYGFIPGYQKATLHKEIPSPSDFGRLLRVLAEEVKPMLTIADGVVGMEGEGPSGGTPVHLGFLGASADAFALDVAICDVLRIPRRSVPYLRECLNNEPECKGVAVEALHPAHFRIPSTFKMRMIPRRLAKLAGFLVWIRPSFDGAKCIRCGRCVKACPVTVLDLATDSKKGDAPYLKQPRKCIGCCCCHEVCPVKAIEMRQSWVLRLARVYKHRGTERKAENTGV